MTRKTVALFPRIILPYISTEYIYIYIYIYTHTETFRTCSGVEARGMYGLRGLSQSNRVE